VDYRNIPHGRYTFRVRAIGAALKWSEPFEYSFIIRPPWWHTWWARICYGIIALIIVYSFVRWRTANLRLRQEQLELEVANATEEIRTQKDEIEAQRDLVTQQKDQILEQKEATTKSIQYAKRIQTAILPPDEVLKYLPRRQS